MATKSNNFTYFCNEVEFKIIFRENAGVKNHCNHTPESKKSLYARGLKGC